MTNSGEALRAALATFAAFTGALMTQPAEAQATAQASASATVPTIAAASRTPTQPIAAPADPAAIPLYGAATPGSTAGEIWTQRGEDRIVRNVTRPMLTPVLPDPAKATGAAVIVAPGGGFMALSMGTEGWAVARRLADHGIAAFVLKYRLIPTPVDEREYGAVMIKTIMGGLGDPTKPPTLQFPAATEDALAALKLVRGNAAQWHVDPHRVGMIGFSAGAMTAMNTVLAAKPGVEQGNGPDFVGYIYGPQAKVDVPVEIHAYQRGSHGFGLGRAGTTTTLVFDEFIAWLDMQGFLAKAATAPAAP